MLKKFAIPVAALCALTAAVIAVSAYIALRPRVDAENENMTACIIADYRDVASLAADSGASPDDVLKRLRTAGVSALMVSEFIGEELSAGALPLFFGSTEHYPELSRQGYKGSVVIIPDSLEYGDELASYLVSRFSATRVSTAEGIAVIIPFGMKYLDFCGVVPDFEGLYAAEAAGMPVLWRVAVAHAGGTDRALGALAMLIDAHKSIFAVSPAGDIAIGYPNMAPLARVLKEGRVKAAQVEFSRQLGGAQFESLMFPDLIPLHSVTQEEVLSRRLSRQTLYERFVRAASERSVRLLVLRPAITGASADPVADFAAEIKQLSEGLTARGLFMRPSVDDLSASLYPSSIKPTFAGMLACAAAFVYSLLRFVTRYAGRVNKKISFVEFAVAVAAVLVSAAAMRYSASAARFVGAFAAVFIITEASFAALDAASKPALSDVVWSAFKGFVVAVVGGLAIASAFSYPLYMLRLSTFSGVKLMLALPPLLVLFCDLHRRVHPESFRAVISRPPLWGELMLAVVMMAGVGLILFRSDNVKFIPAFEAQVREFFERVLIARPRNKEIVLGFPCLILYWYMVRSKLWARYREVLRLGVVIGFSSVVNSFCHFHTPLMFILIRQINGLWVGMLVGAAVTLAFAYIARPLFRRFERTLTD